jgi:hypothetical protein
VTPISIFQHNSLDATILGIQCGGVVNQGFSLAWTCSLQFILVSFSRLCPHDTSAIAFVMVTNDLSLAHIPVGVQQNSVPFY